MSAPAGVVAVLKALAAQTRRVGGSPSAETIDAAAAAVAELVEADAAYNTALAKCGHDVVTRNATDAQMNQLSDAAARRRAAIACVKGAA